MRLVVSEPASALITERGGRLYVWPKRGSLLRGCYAPRIREHTAGRKKYRRVDAAGGCEVYVPTGLARLPEQLQVELKRYPRRIESYWDGCAFVVVSHPAAQQSPTQEDRSDTAASAASWTSLRLTPNLRCGGGRDELDE